MYQLLSTIIISLSMQAESTMTLSPSGAVFVCPGGQLSFRCSTNLRYLEWNITVFQPLTGNSDSRRQLITSISVDSLPLTISGYSFSVTRNSADNSYPLTSTVTIASVVDELSNARINCTEIGNSLAETNTSIAIINVIRPDLSVLNPFLEIDEQFGSDNITVIMGLSEQESVLDSFIIVPQAIKSHNGSTNVVLKNHTTHCTT